MEKCPKISIEKLIEYCDGELPQKETEQISLHIADCQICKANIKALQNSLTLARNIWESEKEKWGDLTRVMGILPMKHGQDGHATKKNNILLDASNKQILNKFPVRKLIYIAAGIIIIFAISLIWLLSNSDDSTNHMTLTAKEIEIKAEHAAIAAQLLAVGDMYAAQPGAEEYAVQRYNDLIESFPSSPQSEQAKLHLQKLLERKIQ